MQFAAPMPWWGLVVAVAIAMAVAFVAYARPAVPLTIRQRASLMALRLCALLAVLLLLLQPVRTEPAPRDAAVVAVLIDHSRSMGIRDADAGSRLERAVAVFRERVLPSLGDEFEIEILSFGDALEPLDLDALDTFDAHAARSDLAGALEAAAERFAGRPIAGFIVISDGGETGDREAATVARRSATPVYAIGVGARRRGRDREVVGVMAGETTAADSVVDVSASLVSYGYGDSPVDLRLLEDGRLLQVRRVTPRDGAPLREVFRVSPNPDVATLYTVQVPVDAGELATGNNARSVLVRPPERPRRILVVEGAPGYEHSFLKRAWLADDGVVIDAVVRKGQNDQGERTFYVQGDSARTGALSEGYPLTRAALFRYDGVVLANVDAESFRPEQLTMTAEFVSERGGGVLLLGAASLGRRGLAGSALEPVLPVELIDRRGLSDPADAARDAYRLALTADGESHPMMQLAPTFDATLARWREVPALGGTVPVGAAKPGASVLAVTSSAAGPAGRRPLVVVQRYGAGRAMVFAGRSAWRWRMLLPADDLVYETYWGQVARWLTGNARDQVDLTTRGGAMPGEPVHLDVLVRSAEFRPLTDAAPLISVTDPIGDRHEVQPTLADGTRGRFRATIHPTRPGVYRVDTVVTRDGERVGTARDWLLVGGADPELADPWLNEEVLRRTAAAGGGAYVDRERLDDLRALILSGAGTLVRTVTHPLWHNVWMFILLAGILSAEWSLRRRWGMR